MKHHQIIGVAGSPDSDRGPVTALVVHDDAQVLRMAVRLLREQGVDSTGASSLVEARALVADTGYDLVVAHLTLADGAGADLTADLARQHPETATILISGSGAEGVAEEALEEGVDDYLAQPFSPEQLSVSVTRALRRRLERSRASDARRDAQNEQGVAAHNRLAEEVLDCLTRAGRFRDEETAEHVERVSRGCALIAGEMGLAPHDCGMLRAASAMHDIGKIGVPDAVLGKPGKLNSEERALIERHAEVGHQILSGSSDPVLDLAATIAWTHHERPDGQGYPRGLGADEIPLGGRITAVADVFDALTHDRVYRPALAVGDALEVMTKGDGSQFDRQVLAAFHAVLPLIEQIGKLYPDSSAQPVTPGGSEAGVRPLRILIVEDQAAMARGLSLLLLREGMEIAGVAGNLAEADRLVAQRDVDVAILDADLDGEDGLRLVPAIRARGARVLMYTGVPVPVARPPEETPDGVASKTGGPAELLAAIRDVAAGGNPSDSRVHARASRLPSLSCLTPREREIAALLARGLGGEEIAAQLFLSPYTVRTHIRNAMSRAGAKTRAHLIALALATDDRTPAEAVPALN